MLRILKSPVASADLSSAVETRNHFKNRVSPKNDRSRRNFFAILLIFLISLNTNTVMGQQKYYFGYSWENKSVVIDGVKGEYNVVTRVTNSLPAHIAGLRPFDVILSENTSEDGTKTLTVKRTGNRTLNIRINGVPVLSDSWYDEYIYSSIVFRKLIILMQMDVFLEPISIIADPEADLFACKTFDFEYSNQNTLIQKEVAAILESKLQSKGLKRDRENPDLLIFIDFTVDRKDQYVPPTQQLETRYNTIYNPWTKRNETRQYVESYTQGNYTRTEYIHAFTISMADVSKMKANGNESSMVRQADYIISNLYSQKSKVIKL
jgi:hypothetical protein